eukprot:XP_011676072.1 PREDICTED: uncharacterized protein LOC105444020 [Strongylocentrotus purpuratus]
MTNKDRLDFDDILRAVAGKTKQDTEIDDLGRALQISPHDIESAKVANRHGVSHMGSLNLLRDWAKRQKSSTMKQNLKDALEKLQWFEILGECYPEVGADTVTVPTKRNPSRTSGLPMDTTDDSSEQYGAAGQSHPSPSPVDSSGQHGAAGPSHPPTPHDKWQNRTVRPAKSGPDESDREMQYVMWESSVKGNALIISNEDFPQPGDPRPWADMDIMNMTGLLKKVGYGFRNDQNIYKNLTKSVYSSGQHGAAGPSHPPTPHDKWQNRTVRPAKSGPDESDREMQYVMWESSVKGNALIISNEDFPQPGDPRPWADMDIMNMTGLLKKVGYGFRNDQNIYKNLTKSEMKDTVKEFTEQLKKDNPQSAVVYISSHGNEKGVQGKDGGILQIRDLLEMFSRVLPGKPKVLIIDACWGDDETNRLPVSASSSSLAASTTTFLPENADIFMIHSTSYGKKTWSYLTKGSWLVDELCKVVYNNDRDLEDLDTIMLRVSFLPRHLLLQNNLPETGSPKRWLKNGTDSRPLVTQTCQRLPKADFFYSSAFCMQYVWAVNMR